MLGMQEFEIFFELAFIFRTIKITHTKRKLNANGEHKKAPEDFSSGTQVSSYKLNLITTHSWTLWLQLNYQQITTQQHYRYYVFGLNHHHK